MANYTAGTAYLAIRPNMTGFHPALRNELRTLNPQPQLDVTVMPKYTAASATELRRQVNTAVGKPNIDVTINPQWSAASARALRDSLRSVVPPPTIDITIKPQWTAVSTADLRDSISSLNPSPTVDIRIRPVWRGASNAELRAALRALNPEPVIDTRINPVWNAASAAALRAALRGITPPPSMDVRINPVWRGGSIPPLPDQSVNVKAKVDKRSISDAINGFAALARSMSLIALGGGAAAAIPILGALAGAAVASAGALLLIPAAGAAAGLAIGALKVGMTGFADTLKETDPAKYAEGLAKLAPNARATAVEIRSLAPAWAELRLDVQNRLFANLGTYIGEIATRYLPLLRTGLNGAAEGLNLAAGGVSEFFDSTKTFTDIGTIFSNSNLFIRSMSQSLDDVLRIFRDVAAVGSEFLPGLGIGWRNAASGAAEYVANARETGALRDTIQGGLDALRDLGTVFGNVGAIIGTVWRAAGESGNTMLDSIIRSTTAARDFLNTSNGYGALVTIFATLRGVIDALMPGLLFFANSIATGIQILGPALPPIATAFGAILGVVSMLIPPVAQVVASLASGLVPAVIAAVPIMSQIAMIIGEVLLVALRAVEPLFPIITATVRELVPPLAEAARVLGDGFVRALEILAPALPPIVRAAGDLAVALGPLVVAVVRLASEIAVALMPIIPPLVEIFTRLINDAVIPLIPPITRIVEALIPGLVGTIRVLIPIVSTVASIFADVLVWVINSLVIPALDLLGGWIETANAFWAEFGRVVEQVWRDAGAFIDNAWNGVIRPVWEALVGFIQGVLEVAFNVLWTTVRIAIGAIGAIITLAWTTIIKPIWDALVAFVTNVLGPIFTWFRDNIITPVWNFIQDKIGQAWNWIRDNVFNPIVSFLRDTMSPGFTSARDTIAGVWANIQSVSGAAWTWVRTNVFDPMVNFVTRTIPDAYNTAVRIIGDVWNQIKRAMRDPVQAVIDVVYNRGIVASWNTIADFVGLPGQKLATFTLPAYATGGPVMREQVARLGEEGPEYVLSAPAVRNLGGIGAVDQLHAHAREHAIVHALDRGQIVEGADHDGPGYSTVGFGGVRPWVAKAGHELRRRFGIGTVGGVGSRPNASDHPGGLALDFMTTGENGTQLANHVIANRGHYGVKYAIWRQQINKGTGWSRMEDRGSPTANHMDHVHVSFTGGAPGTGTGNTGGLVGGTKAEPAFDPLAWVMGILPDLGGLLSGIGGGGPVVEIVKGFGGKIWNAIKDFAIAKATDWGGGAKTVTGPGAKNVDAYRGVVLQALAAVGQPASNADRTLRRMAQESGGNPQAVNRNDINWRRGTPSVGLMQVIGPTFRAHAGRYVNTPPQLYGVSTDPMANIYASMRYAVSRYGSLAGYDRAGGYDKGGLAVGAGFLPKQTVLPERVLDSRQTRAFESLMMSHAGVSFGGTNLIVDRGGDVAPERGAGGGDGPLIGTLVVPTPEGAGVQETVDTVFTRARHHGRGRRYGRP